MRAFVFYENFLLFCFLFSVIYLEKSWKLNCYSHFERISFEKSWENQTFIVILRATPEESMMKFDKTDSSLTLRMTVIFTVIARKSLIFAAIQKP